MKKMRATASGLVVAAVVTAVSATSLGALPASAAGGRRAGSSATSAPTVSPTGSTTPSATPTPTPTPTPTATPTTGKGSGSKGGSSGSGQKSGKGGGNSYTAPNRPFFNDPRKGPKQQGTIERQILAALNHAKKGTTVRIALYSFDRVPVAQALVRAAKRGVKIQMLLNDHQDTKAMKMVRAAVGSNPKRKHFLYKCKSSCRGALPDRNLHSKFYLFDQAGKSSDVLMVGSHNFTRNALVHQWNDLYITSGDAPLYDQFVALFDDMRHDYNKTQPAIYFCGTPVGATCDDSVDKYTNWAFPKRSTPKSDVVLDMLNKITCVTNNADGTTSRTKLALSMHTLRGKRGDYLARAIRQKYAEGCDFRVDYGLIGYKTKQILGAPTSRGRIPLRSTGFDYNPYDTEDLNNDGIDDAVSLNLYTHQKYFVIQGTYNNIPNYSMVLTGSSNWASLGTAQDEVFFTIADAKVAKKYVKNFDRMWYGKGNSRNAYTTTYSNFRVSTQARDEEGQPVATTVRRATTRVLPDHHKAGGRYWEGD